MKKYLDDFDFLSKEWNYKKNNALGISITGILKYSNKKVWWKCPLGHEWESIVANRVKGQGCPICIGKKVLKGFNDLTTTHPELIKEWDYEKNDIKPEEISKGSNKKVWWKCHLGHEWESKVIERTFKKNGCPYCSGHRVLKGFNDLITTHSELIREWNYEKNDIKPEELSKGSNKKVWWKCPLGHEWESIVANRVKGQGCPICIGQKILKGFNDLATTHPELIKEWDYEKNDIKPEEISKGSRKKTWWKCELNHSWEASVYSRVDGSSCPICSMSKKTSFPEQAIYYYIKKIFPDTINSYKEIFTNGMEIDVYVPSLKLGIEYDGIAFHNSLKTYEVEMNKYRICKDNNIRLIRVKENKNHYKSNTCDVLLFCDYCNRNYSKLDESINKIINLLNVNFNVEVNTEKDKIFIEEQYLMKKKVKSLANINPKLVNEWHPTKNGNLTPALFSAGSSEKVWWKCPLGHEWNANISSRAKKGLSCPYCSGHKVLRGFNDLVTTHPELIKEWDYEKNDIKPEEISKGSRKKTWWKCELNHSWEASVYSRVDGTGCPYCSGYHKVLRGFNDLATTHPELIKEWDYEKNDIKPEEISKGSHKKVWWKCHLGHSYSATTSHRANGTGCPYCSGHRVLKGFNDLTTTHPELIKEWDYEKNYIKPEEISKGSRKKAWWKCYLGHSYSATTSHRIEGTGCPYCSGHKVIEGYNDFASHHPDSLKEWDYEKNGALGIFPKSLYYKTNKKVWFKCSKGHSYQRKVINISNNNNCPYCYKCFIK